MSEPVRIKITPDSKMVEIPIDQWKEYKCRVSLEIMFDVNLTARTEEEAGASSEYMVEQIARHLADELENADGIHLPSSSECWMSTWGVRNTDVEERSDE